MNLNDVSPFSEGESGDGGHSGGSAGNEAASATVIEGAGVELLGLSGVASGKNALGIGSNSLGGGK